VRIGVLVAAALTAVAPAAPVTALAAVSRGGLAWRSMRSSAGGVRGRRMLRSGLALKLRGTLVFTHDAGKPGVVRRRFGLAY
jgi:hypothetical protein